MILQLLETTRMMLDAVGDEGVETFTEEETKEN